MAPAGRAGNAANGRVLNRPAGGDHLTAVEVADILRVTVKTLRNWRYLGTGPTFIPGRIPLYPRDAVDNYLAARAR